MTYYESIAAIRKRYQYVNDAIVGNYKRAKMYSHNDLVGVYNQQDYVFDWFRYYEYLGYGQSGSTLMLPEGATLIHSGV